MGEFIWPVRVYYEDVDIGGIVYHANYLKFIERTRTEWSRNIGLEQIQQQSILVIRQINIDFLKPAVLHDELQIAVRLMSLGRTSITLQQDVCRGGEILCTAAVKMVCVDRISLRPQVLCEEQIEILSHCK
ncbi:MAG: tol-pal system-associated acyl-CoA thioesterase [Beggiatoa sp. IS2]|nr:MAG: tol-pal system-associated acyl-CoA thioesterase [Beggiatoa sp. IS2]